MMMCKQAIMQTIPTGVIYLSESRLLRPHKEKVVVILGATGTGKSRLSVDIGTRFKGEIINSDKIQVYEGLDIVTNKITEEERRDVPHHLLGIVDPEADFNAEAFASKASLAMKSIVGREKLPIIAGGSNSFVEKLVDDNNFDFRSRYDVCFLWVDVAMQVLNQFVSERVDRMVAAGMVEELREMYNPNKDYSKGIRRAIGVPEFDEYFRSEHSSSTDQQARNKLLQIAINDTKLNTCKLGCRQVEKIKRLMNDKEWPIHRLDATKVFEKKGREADKAWEEHVAGPASLIVFDFLFGVGCYQGFSGATIGSRGMRGISQKAQKHDLVTY